MDDVITGSLKDGREAGEKKMLQQKQGSVRQSLGDAVLLALR
jgi:hypothetical protein